MRHRVEQLLTHAHQRRGAAGSKIKPPKQFLPTRLGRLMHVGCGLVVRLFLPSLDRALHARAVGPEVLSQCFEKGDARTDGAGWNSGSGFRAPAPRPTLRRGPKAAPRTAQQNPPSGYRSVTALARQIEQLPPAVRNGLQHIAEKGGRSFRQHPVYPPPAALRSRTVGLPRGIRKADFAAAGFPVGRLTG